MRDIRIVEKQLHMLSNKLFHQQCELLKFVLGNRAYSITFSERVFILGPSHVVALNGCAITTCSKYRTPLGDLIVDHKSNLLHS